MNIVSRKVPNVVQNPTNLLSLKDIDRDMFLDLFAADFAKVAHALS